MRKALSEKKVNVETLVIFFFYGETIIGDLKEGNYNNLKPGSLTRVQNPKRVIRQMFRGPQGQMGVSFGMGDFDLFTSGSSIEIIPTAFSKLADQPEDMQEAYLSLYEEHIRQKALASAVQAGIELPPSIIQTR